MRYIINAAGYVKNISFGALLTCGGMNCTEYTGAVPEGFDTLEEWYLAESECLYRWKIVNGNLTRDDEAEAPPIENSFAKKDHIAGLYVLKASGWLDSAYGYYRQTIDIPLIKEDSVIDISLHPNANAEQAKAYMQLGLQPGDQADGTAVLRAFGKVPTIDLNIFVVIRDCSVGTTPTGAAVSLDDGTLSLL